MKYAERTTDEQLSQIKGRFGVPAEWIDWDMCWSDPDTGLRNDGFADGEHGATLMLESMVHTTDDGEVMLSLTVNSVRGVAFELRGPDDQYYWFGWHPTFGQALMSLAKEGMPS